MISFSVKMVIFRGDFPLATYSVTILSAMSKVSTLRQILGTMWTELSVTALCLTIIHISHRSLHKIWINFDLILHNMLNANCI